jgi:hypothetical protein
MKNILGFVFVAASMMLASSAQAQEYRLKADVPFDFVVGNQIHKAGNYDIKKLMPNSSLLLLESSSQSKPTIVNPHACAERDAATSTKLVFHRSGDTYFLYQIWVEGRQFGSEFTTPKMETKLAQNGTKSDDVIIAAVLEH